MFFLKISWFLWNSMKTFFTFGRKMMISHLCVSLPQMLLKPMEYYTFWVVLGAMGSLFEKSAFSLKFLENVEKVGNHGISNFAVKMGNFIKPMKFMEIIGFCESGGSKTLIFLKNYCFFAMPWISWNWSFSLKIWKFHDISIF